MKNTIKFLGIIAFVAIIGFSFTACGEENVKELSGKITPIDPGNGIYSMRFSISDSNAASNFQVTFTTNIPGHESFILTGGYDGTYERRITLGTGGEFTWKAVGNEFIEAEQSSPNQLLIRRVY